MTPADAHRVRFRPWVAVASGVIVGASLAILIVLLWPTIVGGTHEPGRARLRPDTLVELFRDAEASTEIVLVRCGPDASGEPELAKGLFPGEEPAREIASLVLVNSSSDTSWDIDLRGSPLRGRTAADAPWESLEPLALERSESLSPALALRFRALAGPGTFVHVEPGSLRRVLVALPPGRTIGDLSDVQWGERALARERIDVESFHALRDPTVSGARTPPRR